MAGYDDGDGIGSIGGADGADGGGMADLFGKFAVGDGGAAGNATDGMPDFALERGSGGLDGEIVDGVEFAGKVAGDGGGEAVGIGCGLEVKSARSILIGEVTVNGIIVVGEEGEAQAARVVGDEHHLANGSGESIEKQLKGFGHRCGLSHGRGIGVQ